MTKARSRLEIARVLDEARVRQKLSIRMTAKMADVPAATVQGWLNGRHLPTPALRPRSNVWWRCWGSRTWSNSTG